MVALQAAAEDMMAAVARTLRDPYQFHRYAISGKAEDKMPREVILAKADTKAMRDMAVVLKDMTAAVRNLYDIGTRSEESAVEIAKARLLLEQERANTPKQPTGKEGGIVVLPPDHFLREEDLSFLKGE